MTGGLSLIFCRLAISGETKIRSNEIENPETVKKVLGLDANSLYLHAIAQNNPTGYFYCYKEEEDFRPDPCSKFALQSYQWLSYVAYKENMFLQTRFNMGERRVSKYNLPVDGYSEQQNTVYQYLGCFFHSCDRCNTNRNSDGSLKVMHPLRNTPHEDIREETKNNKKRLEEEGFRVVEMRKNSQKASLMSQCSHSPHRQCFERRLAHSYWMPASHSNGPSICTLRHPAS